MAGTAGLEPVTSRVTGGCSNQLSYAPRVPHKLKVVGTKIYQALYIL